MPVKFDILNDLGILYIQYIGVVPLEEGVAAAHEWVKHPDFTSVMPHYVDFSRVACHYRDPVQNLSFQAEMADIYHCGAGEHFSVFYAPEGPGRIMAEYARNSWGSAAHVELRITDSHEQALDILGVTEERFNQSLNKARNHTSKP